ncbi:hypothetical protein ACFZAM_03950 [Streptomyces sp. NPDC008079]|uniref:hypothetical protein n=1 Tax=Streptomyces sp. NPDC008079 TaxID=3364806 RepID=UPI0036E4041C
MTLFPICGETTRLPVSLVRQALRLAGPHRTPEDADLEQDLRCHLQVHGADDHFALVLSFPGVTSGALWARWTEGTRPIDLKVLPDCPSIDPDSREPCCEFADHPGGHSYHLDSASIESF